MNDRTQILLSERESTRIDRLNRAENDIQQQDVGQLASFVLLECVRLWREVIETLGRFAFLDRHETPAARSELADAGVEAPINHLEQLSIDTLVSNFGRVDLNDSVAMHSVAQESLATLEQQLSRLAEPTSSGVTRRPRIIHDSTAGWVDSSPEFTVWRSRAQVLLESLRTLRLLDGLRDRTTPLIDSVEVAKIEAEKASDELSRLRDELTAAHAEKSQGELSNQFKALRNREHATSWAFRLATLALAGLAIAFAINVPTNTDWPDIAAHLAIVAILGGSSAYTARLGSSHRATGDWADSVRVQLNTFQDFLGVVQDEDARMRVYEEFGRRVLGPPPAVNGEPADNGAMPVAQLMQLANEIAANRK